MSDNPLAGLSVPSIEEIVSEALGPFGIAAIDLGDPVDRRRLHVALCRGLASAIRWRLRRPMLQACEKALEHVFMLAEDTDYQEKRRTRRRAAGVKRAERASEQKRKNNIERETRQQANRGLVQ